MRIVKLVIALILLIIYGVSPIDLIPEILLGTLGLFDDFILGSFILYWGLTFGRISMTMSIREFTKDLQKETKIKTKFPDYALENENTKSAIDKIWHLFLLIGNFFVIFVRDFIATILVIILASSNSDDAPNSSYQEMIEVFFTISSNIFTPLLTIGTIITSLIALLLLMRLFDFFGFFKLFDSDFWDFL